MKIMTEDKLELLDEIEKQLNKIDDYVAYKGLSHLINAKQQIWMLKTMLYTEKQYAKELYK